jgi:hypothetical protein
MRNKCATKKGFGSSWFVNITKTMSSTTCRFLKGIAAIALATFVFGCDRKPQNKINYGSCLQAVSTTIRSLRDYAVENGHFPPKNVDLVTLFGGPQGEMNSDQYQMVEYGGTEALTLNSPGRTILVKCNQKVDLKDGKLGIYCALLSGEVVAVPEQYAELGKVCPTGIGETTIPNP